MENYKTRITVRGLRRADFDKVKEPIGEGEVIALPFEVARSLLRAGAVEPTNADVTVELEWGAPVALVKANDKAALLAALAKLGAEIPTMPEGAVVELADVPGVDLLALVSIQLGDGRLSEYDVAAILTPEQALRIVARRLDEDAIDREGLRFLLGMGSGEGAGSERETPPADQSKSDPPTDKPAARGKPKT